MDRRTFIAGMTLAVVDPPRSDAQQPGKIYRVGVLSSFSPSETARWHDAFRKGLHDLGWMEGRNLSIEYRYASGENSRIARLASELVGLKVDVILAGGSYDAAAAKAATSTIPIVMASIGDPVGSGFAQSLARPGGNITGLSQASPELAGKRLQLLKEIVPRLSQVAVLWNPQNSLSVVNWKETQLPARDLRIALRSLPVRTADELDNALADANRLHPGALAIMPDAVFFANLKRIADSALKSRLPSIYHLAEFTAAGGLLSYGVDRPELFRRAAGYVDKILRGAKPAELPIEQPTKFELTVNLKTARVLGVAIPQSVLLRADDVIQ
jgi:putative ABC transport system substrate-binding protein